MAAIGIVGSEGAKFTPATEAQAKALIMTLISPGDTIVSGECHLGGIDLWAKETAAALNLDYVGFPPAMLKWDGGYKQRNMQIAESSDVVYCLTVKRLPATYNGMTFPRCYHCNTTDHIKSGGCWTVKYARKLGKPGHILVIDDQKA